MATSTFGRAELGAKFVGLERMPLATGLIYGLVNVQTDGGHVLCVTMKEKGSEFDVKVSKGPRTTDSDDGNPDN